MQLEMHCIQKQNKRARIAGDPHGHIVVSLTSNEQKEAISPTHDYFFFKEK